MSAPRDIDVLVVGLGPAGAAAAEAAARAGLRVIAAERNAEPGLPVQCAEFVPMMIGGDVPELAASSVQTIEAMETYVGADPADPTPDFRGHMIDRARFDQALIARAQGAGADCRFGLPLRTVDADGGAILGAGGTPELHIRPRLIIGADGPRSVVARAAGCPNRAMVETRQITVDLLRPHRATDIFLRPEIAGGYAWLFPRGAMANLGLGLVPELKSRLKPLLDALHGELQTAGRLGARIHRTTGGLIPVGGITRLATRIGALPVLLAGDAAGLTNPITGAGISAAVVSGREAGAAAGEILAGRAAAAEDYAEEIADVFGPSITLALRRRAALMAGYHGESRPDAQTLRSGWIAYAEYWNRTEADGAITPRGAKTAEAKETA